MIIPCYNQGQFLRDAIESALSQTYSNIEVIVVNDGSDDNTEDVASSMARTDKRLKLIVQGNHGLSAARNTGIRASRGEYLQFLDADDKLEADKIRRHATFLSDHPAADIVYGNARYFTTANPEMRHFGLSGPNASWCATDDWIARLWRSGRPIAQILVGGQNIMPVNAALLRRTVIDQAGWWDESLASSEDWEFWLRCAVRNATFHYLEAEDAMALIRSHDSSMSRDRDRVLEGLYRSRLRSGRYLDDPALLFENYRYGLEIVRQQNGGKLAPVFALAWANRSRRVFVDFAAWALRRHPRVRRLLNSCKRWFVAA